MAFCPKCGFQLISEDNFCPNCGSVVENRQPPVQEEPVPVTPEQAEPEYTVSVTPVYAQPSAPVYPIPTTPVYTAPDAQAYQAQTAVPVVAEPTVSAKTKVLGFVGMGVAIEGLFMAVFGLLYTLAGMSMEGVGFVFALVWGAFSLPSGIVGRFLCNKSQLAGFKSGACTAGIKVGLAAIIVTAVMLFFGFINLVMGA